MAVPPPIDRQTFLANLRQSRLVPEDQLEAILRELPEDVRGRTLARALVQRGLLTKFQAERLLIGRTAGFHLGQYKVLDQIGRGGMGRVFKAEHRTMGRIVALKVLAPDALQTDRAQELFLHEVKAISRLVHPNIVTAFDANQLGGRYFLVLEYVDGPNLDQLVRQQGPLPVGRACDYVRQVALGLHCAHSQGMVHRDIKPANILVQRHGLDDASPGLVKISDFGLARLHRPEAEAVDGLGTILTKENSVLGTPDYLSPEQARSLHNTDIRSDLYSLGCTFYYLLTGAVPFPGGSMVDKMIRHGTEPPRPIQEFRSDCPPVICAIVERLMAKRPEDRFQTPAELAAALEPFAVSGPTPWAPPRPASSPLMDSSAPVTEGLAIDSVPEVDNGPSGDISALVNTVSRDQSPTPMSTSTFSRIFGIETGAQPNQRRWFRSLPLLTLLAILGGFLAGFVLMQTVFGHK
jgi:serine/threonine protein kinase